MQVPSVSHVFFITKLGLKPTQHDSEAGESILADNWDVSLVRCHLFKKKLHELPMRLPIVKLVTD